MECKAYPAFGYILLRTKIKAGEVITDEALVENILNITNPALDHTGSINGSDGAFVWLLINGVHTYKHIRTGEVETHEAGWCNLVRKPEAGIYEFNVIEDSDQICFSPILNRKKVPVIPALDFFNLSNGESCTLAQGTKLYLVDGQLNIEGNVVPSMRQINISSENKFVTAVGNCYGLIFKI